MTKTKLVKPRGKCKVEVYNDGVRLCTSNIGNPSGKGGAKRGSIGGWSRSSRRRMRDFLLTHSLPDSYSLFGCTYTIPGYTLPLELSQKIWQNFRVYSSRKKVSSVWRVEVQKRGQLHWHTLSGIECDDPSEGADILRDLWHSCLSSIGLVPYKFVGTVTEPIEVGFVSGRCGLMDWRGAHKYSAIIEVYSDKTSGWKRYLLDHATKSKQEQIPEDIGRHWGKIGKAAFVPVPFQNYSMAWRQYSKIVRLYNRLCTPYIKHDGALFGRRRGYSCSRGKIGKSAYFASTSTMERLVAWSNSEIRSENPIAHKNLHSALVRCLDNAITKKMDSPSALLNLKQKS